MVQRTQLLAALVRGAALVGGLAAAFGPAFSYTLLRLAYGQRWSETQAPAVLAAYSSYILLVAINGILEVRALPHLNAAHAAEDSAHSRLLHVRVVRVHQVPHYLFLTDYVSYEGPSGMMYCDRNINNP